MSNARAEFLLFLAEASGTHGFAITGLRVLRREVESQHINVAVGNSLQVAWTQDECLNNPDDVASRPAWTRDQFLENLAPSGKSAVYLGWAWITLVYDRWDDDYRHRFASEMKRAPGQVMCDAIGDLRHLRHDVTHRRGIATREHAGKCKLLTDWFTIGHEIMVDAKRISSFYALVAGDESAIYIKRAQLSGRVILGQDTRVCGPRAGTQPRFPQRA